MANVSMQASFGGYHPSNYYHPDNSISEAGNRIAEGIRNLPAAWQAGEKWGQERNQRKANEQMKEDARNNMVAFLKDFYAERGDDLETARAKAEESVPRPMRDQPFNDYVEHGLKPLAMSLAEIPGILQKGEAFRQKAAAQSGQQENRVDAEMQQGQQGQPQVEALTPEAGPPTAAKSTFAGNPTISSRMAAAKAGSPLEAMVSALPDNSPIGGESARLQEMERLRNGQWPGQQEAYNQIMNSSAGYPEQSAPPPATPTQVQPDIPAAPAQAAPTAQQAGPPTNVPIPGPYESAAERRNRGQIGTTPLQALARSAGGKYADDYINHKDAQGANLQTGEEKDITAGITAREQEETRKHQANLAKAKQSFDERMKKAEDIIDGHLKGALVFEKGKQLQTLDYGKVFDDPAGFSLQHRYPPQNTSAYASIGARLETEESRLYQAAVNKLTTINKELTTAEENLARAKKGDFVEGIKTVKDAERALERQRGNYETSLRFMNTIKNKLTNQTYVDGLDEELEKNYRSLGESGAPIGDVPTEYQAPAQEGAEKAQQTAQEKQQNANKRKAEAAVKEINSAGLFGQKYKNGITKEELKGILKQKGVSPEVGIIVYNTLASQGKIK